MAIFALKIGADDSFGIQLLTNEDLGHPTFSSPHSDPIVALEDLVYAVNTPSGTLDVIDTESNEVVQRINVGIDPVSVAVSPDGKEIWVANHISDTISVIDSDPESLFYHQVVATIQDVNTETLQTNFDEPVGIAFASQFKAYVALGPSNRIAVIDVASRSVRGHLEINAQDPRAVVVRNGFLYVIAFESGNTTQLSGCYPQDIDGDTCTYDAIQETHTTNNVLSLNYDADIVKNSKVPDRDLFIFNTLTDELEAVVEGTGSLLYGLSVDSKGNVYIAQAEARNDANGRAGTQKHGMAEMENRAFLNQITKVDCSSIPCETPEFFELEPLPPDHPDPGMALATPFAVQVSDDDSTIVATAAGSDMIFTLDVSTGEILGRVEVGPVPRGLHLVSTSDEGVPSHAWVHSVVENTVSRIDLSSLSDPQIAATIPLEDPTPNLVKQGRIAFNDANASTTGTFSCESCHPDNNVDQLIWVLDTPECDHPGCTQIPPRLTMPARGLRDTQPYHWDGIPGDPYGGVNASSLWDPVDPNCEHGDPEACIRVLIDGSLATTMCEEGNCGENDEGKAGLLDALERDALARYLLSVPFPPAPNRPFDNELSASAKTGIFEFNFLNDSGIATGAQACGACHKPPFLTSTNTPSSDNLDADVGSFNGMDAPTWRGAYDRWIVTPQARFNVIDLIERIGMDLGGSLPEQEIWFHAGARTQANWDMVLEFSTGFSGTYARQVTLSEHSIDSEVTSDVLDALIGAANDSTIVLRADGIVVVDADSETVTGINLEFQDGKFVDRADEDGEDVASYSRVDLEGLADSGNLVLTLTAHIGPNVGFDTPQPAIWPYWTIGENTFNGIEQQSPTVEITYVSDNHSIDMKGRHIQPDSTILVNGFRVDGKVSCQDGELPNCTDELIVVELDQVPARYGLNFLQIQTPRGMISNDVMFFSQQSTKPFYSGNLIVSGGDFTFFEFPLARFWNTVELNNNRISHRNGAIRATIATVNTQQPWRAQISHTVSVEAGQEYTLCYSAKATSDRTITAYLDRNMHGWQNLSEGQFSSDLTTEWQDFEHTFTVDVTDITARVAFDLAQHRATVDLDDIGFYEGTVCGNPRITHQIGFRAGN
ncbi:MAG: carbohydrate binding domain-containing protein [Gammaproteobacteria bacterium]|nr:carbohydrate binding domain-containing protein [Gammaproteobacteria bacterium]